MTASKLKSTAGNPIRECSTLSKALASLLLLAAALPAQPPSPASWTLKPLTTAAPGSAFAAELKLTLAEPWHMYSLTTPKPGPTGGPTATTIRLAENPVIASFSVWYPAPARHFDPNFQINTETYEKETAFFLTGELSSDAPVAPLEITAQMRYQLCNDKECLPPKRVTASAQLQVTRGAGAAVPAPPAGYSEFRPAAPAPQPPESSSSPTPADQGLGSYLLLAFGFGLAAIFTPCVFPMIPITMSFFLNRPEGSRGQPLVQAAVFCGGIVLLFTSIGLGLSAALGPFAVVQLGSNPWVNGFLTLVFLAFGLSLLGAFEITLPSGLLTKLNAASNRGGLLGTLLMGLTFSLASFACIGPFMGTLLAAAVGGEKLRPALGMIAFSSALAAPFFLLALFPGYLTKLPRSGGWMSRVKVVLGFLVLAAMLKYLANIDQVLQWDFLTRERFLALWVVLFSLPGLYLMGLLRMEGVRGDENVGIGRLLAGVFFLGFALSLLPGMFGGRLGEIDAYVPAASESAQPAGGATSSARWLKNDLDAALTQAKAGNKLVLVAFTGYACTNCHWMKANMFPKAEIAAALEALVPVELYTDGTDAASEANQKLQDQLFHSVAIPYYALLDSDRRVVAGFAGLTKDTGDFLRFLKSRP